MSLSIRLHSVSEDIIREAYCLACDRKPDRVRAEPSPHDASEVVLVSCHGATHHMALTEDEVMAGSLKSFVRQLRNLFAEHAHPDVKELLRYNREGWTQ